MISVQRENSVMFLVFYYETQILLCIESPFLIPYHESTALYLWWMNKIAISLLHENIKNVPSLHRAYLCLFLSFEGETGHLDNFIILENWEKIRKISRKKNVFENIGKTDEIFEEIN